MAGFNSTITGLIRPHMKAEDVTQRYHDSWNKRDADALVGAFIEGGTYHSPDTPPEGVSAQDFAAFVKGVWTAFPDLSVEVIEAGEIRAGVVAHEWIVRGTNSGREPMTNLPLDAQSHFAELPYFTWRETRFAQKKCILTERDWINSSD